MNNQLEFAGLFQSNARIVHKICNTYCNNEEDKKDLFQDIAISAWAAYPQFRGESKFSTWLYSISLNRAFQSLRDAQRKIKELASANVFYELTSECASIDIENGVLYKNYVGLLDDKELKFVLMYADGYSYLEMAEELGVKPNNLRVRMDRIKHKLRSIK